MLLKVWYLYWIWNNYIGWTHIGTERCNEALQKLEKEYDVVVNIQGDEPLIEPEIIDGIVKALQVNHFSSMSAMVFDALVQTQWSRLLTWESWNKWSNVNWICCVGLKS